MFLPPSYNFICIFSKMGGPGLKRGIFCANRFAVNANANTALFLDRECTVVLPRDGTSKTPCLSSPRRSSIFAGRRLFPKVPNARAELASGTCESVRRGCALQDGARAMSSGWFLKGNGWRCCISMMAFLRHVCVCRQQSATRSLRLPPLLPLRHRHLLLLPPHSLHRFCSHALSNSTIPWPVDV